MNEYNGSKKREALKSLMHNNNRQRDPIPSNIRPSRALVQQPIEDKKTKKKKKKKKKKQSKRKLKRLDVLIQEREREKERTVVVMHRIHRIFGRQKQGERKNGKTKRDGKAYRLKRDGQNSHQEQHAPGDVGSESTPATVNSVATNWSSHDVPVSEHHRRLSTSYKMDELDRILDNLVHRQKKDATPEMQAFHECRVPSRPKTKQGINNKDNINQHYDDDTDTRFEPPHLVVTWSNEENEADCQKKISATPQCACLTSPPLSPPPPQRSSSSDYHYHAYQQTLSNLNIVPAAHTPSHLFACTGSREENAVFASSSSSSSSSSSTATSLYSPMEIDSSMSVASSASAHSSAGGISTVIDDLQNVSYDDIFEAAAFQPSRENTENDDFLTEEDHTDDDHGRGRARRRGGRRQRPTPINSKEHTGTRVGKEVKQVNQDDGEDDGEDFLTGVVNLIKSGLMSIPAVFCGTDEDLDEATTTTTRTGETMSTRTRVLEQGFITVSDEDETTTTTLHYDDEESISVTAAAMAAAADDVLFSLLPPDLHCVPGPSPKLRSP